MAEDDTIKVASIRLICPVPIPPPPPPPPLAPPICLCSTASHPTSPNQPSSAFPSPLHSQPPWLSPSPSPPPPFRLPSSRGRPSSLAESHPRSSRLPLLAAASCVILSPLCHLATQKCSNLNETRSLTFSRFDLASTPPVGHRASFVLLSRHATTASSDKIPVHLLHVAPSMLTCPASPFSLHSVLRKAAFLHCCRRLHWWQRHRIISECVSALDLFPSTSVLPSSAATLRRALSAIPLRLASSSFPPC